MRIPRISSSALLLTPLCLILAAGCADNSAAREQLVSGEQALSAQQYDQAIRDADAVLASSDSQDAADAYYLRGRAIEERQGDAPAKARDKTLARESYAYGLSLNPRPLVAGRLHAQIANLDYQENRYPSALREFSAALPLIDDAPTKALVLYRMGVCQQRVGRFVDADRTFEQVQQQYPGSEMARRARAHEGIRAFYVQVGEFAKSADADRAAAAVSACGSVPLKTMQRGLTVIRTADVPAYAQAIDLKDRLATYYPDVTIMP